MSTEVQQQRQTQTRPSIITSERQSLAPSSKRKQAALFIRNFAAFYFSELKPVFSGSWKWAAGVSTGLGILFYFIQDKIKPTGWEARMTSLLWQLPLFAGLAFFAGKFLFYLPFRKYQELKERSEKTEKALRDDIESSNVEHARELTEVTASYTKALAETETRHAKKLDDAIQQERNHFYSEVLPEEKGKLNIQIKELYADLDALINERPSLIKKIETLGEYLYRFRDFEVSCNIYGKLPDDESKGKEERLEKKVMPYLHTRTKEYLDSNKDIDDRSRIKNIIEGIEYIIETAKRPQQLVSRKEANQNLLT